RTIVQPLGGRQLLLLAARRGNRVDIEIAVPLADERKGLSIRRPAMPIRRGLLRNAPRRAAADRHNVNKRLVVLLRVVADRQPRAVRRNSVIIVAARPES